MLNISVILAHPYKKSFNHAIAHVIVKTLCANGYHVAFHDLFAEGFNPVIKDPELTEDRSGDGLVEQHCKEIKATDGIVIIHPNWWGMPPAILKGWIDRVLRPGVAYRFDEEDSGGGIPEGLLKAKAALVFNTSNTPKEREDSVFGDPLETIWRNCIFDFCGVKNYHRVIYRVIADSAAEQRTAWLKETEEVINIYFPKEL